MVTAGEAEDLPLQILRIRIKPQPLYEYFVKKLEQAAGTEVKTGVFAADMDVELINDGPVTIMMDSGKLF